MKKSKVDVSLLMPLVLSLVTFIIGCLLIIFDTAFNEKMTTYLAVMFYIIAFTSFVIYFVGRKHI